MSSKFTLDKIDLSVKIKGSDITSHGCVISACSVSFSINSLSRATIGIVYRTERGLSYLKSLFPQGMTTSASYAEVEVSIKDGGRFGYINAGTIFKGFLVGFQQIKSVGGVSYSLQCSGGMFRSDRIFIGSPAYNIPGPSIHYSVKYSTGAKEYKDAAEKLRLTLITSKNVVHMYNRFVDFYEESIKSSNSIIGKINTMALKSYGLVKGKSSVINKEIDDLVLVPGIDNFLDWEDHKSSFATSLAIQAFSNPTLTFYKFFLQILDAYGLVMVTIWDKTFITVKATLADPYNYSPNNIFTEEDIIAINIADSPFYAPTRCVVASTSTVKVLSKKGDKEEAFPFMGCYPSYTRMTPQEKLTGVKAHFVNPINLFEWLRVIDKKRKNPQGSQSKGTNPPVLEKIPAEKTQKLLDMYAKYVLMKEQCQQKTGSANLRLRLDVVPGLTASFEDPFKMSNVYGFINSVSHNFSSSSASTNVAFNFINYPNQFSGDERGNPLYPTFNYSNVLQVIGSGGFGTFWGGD